MPFGQIVGQERAIRFLQASLLKGTVSHAYLFTGPDGVGKRLTAFGLAKAVNCLERNGDFCGQCDSCRRIEQRTHPDLFLIEPEAEGARLKIEQVRELQAAVGYRPYLARRAVCIIDQAERMTEAAANSMLKTLEEPPAAMLIVMVTASLERILPTIRSRCQVVRFSPLPKDDLERLIGEQLSIPADKVRLLVHLSGGSLGRARRIDLASLQDKRERIFGLLDSLSSEACVEVLFSQAKKLADEEDVDSLQQFLDLWLYWYYDLWKYQLTGDERGLINTDRMKEIIRQSQILSSHQIEENIRLIEETSAALQRNVNKQLALETMMLRLGGGQREKDSQVPGEG
ncbi:MAG: DNA polymerase III subunit delta' [bacterium]|nr:DNA polymerase III subunit delta' [bacterium]